MKKKSQLAALCFLIPLACQADTFTLKDGVKLEGKILSETPDSYVLEVQVTKSIKDERKIAKSDVVKVDREQPDLKAFEAIAKLVPTPDLWSSDDYQIKMAAVRKFIKEYPTSSKVKAAQTILDTLTNEFKPVGEGGIKLNGKILSREEFLANAYELDARVQEAKIQKLVKDEQPLEALRQFVGFDRDYRTTLAYGSLMPVIRQVIQNQVADAQQLLQSYDARLKERDLGLQRIPAEDRGTTQLAIREEAAAVEARYKSEKDAKQVWLTTSPFHKSSLDETVRFGTAELTRLAAVKATLGVDGGKAYRDLYTAVHSGGSAADVKTALAAAKSAAIPTRYLAPLETAAKGRK